MREKLYKGNDKLRRSPPSRQYSPPSRHIERSRRIQSGNDRQLLDEERENHSWKLSQFNESLSVRNSTWMKFQWKQLLGEPKKLSASKENHSLNYSDSNDYYGVNATRVISERTNYQESRYSDMGQSISVESERGRRNYPSTPLDDVGFSKSYGSGIALSSRGLDEIKVNKSLARESYKEVNSPIVYLWDDGCYMKQASSQSKGFCTESLGLLEKEFPGSMKKCVRVSSGGAGLNAEMVTSTVVHDVYDRKLRSKSLATRNYPLTYHFPVEEEHADYTYPDGPRVERGNAHTVSDDFHVNATVEEDYTRNSLPRTSIFDSIVDRIDECSDCSHDELLRERRVGDRNPSLQGEKVLDNVDLSRSLHSREQDKKVLDSRSAHRKYERDINLYHGSLLSGEDHGYEKLGVLPVEYEQRKVNHDHRSILSEEDHGYERSETLLVIENDRHLDEIDGDPQQKLAAAECCLPDEQSRQMLKRKHHMDEKPSRLYNGKIISCNEESGCKIHDQGDAFEQLTAVDGEPLFSSKKLRSSHSLFTESERASYETASDWISNSDELLSSENLPVSMPWHVENPHNSSSKDIPKCLGPQPQDIHASHPFVEKNKPSGKKRLGPSLETSKPSVKQSLGPSPKKVHIALPGMKNQNPQKLPRRICDDSNDGVHVQHEEPLIGDMIPTKAEPPENSQEFKQLVHSAFFRFVKQLNENSAQRRRIMEQGKSGSLKCSVCGSNSKEFVNAQNLVIHAFYSQEVGLRSLHLGFHRALCVLIGWKGKTAASGPWFRDLLSDGETLFSKEDLIIWPPVVIIHNSSIKSNNPDERVIVSIEVLESILRGMGFGERTKVCRGRPANQSIMVVKFNSTLSGLQAAERLHKFYAETKHGKAEFQRINTCSSSCTGEAPKAASAEKVEHVLYGYLGIAEDLEKLDFETKKRCVVKSKKAIQRIADGCSF